MTNRPEKESVGTYQLEQRLGTNDIGAMYEARDSQTGKKVMLQLVDKRLAANESIMPTIRSEVRKLSRLRHQNIATVYGLEEGSFGTFVVMERVHGQTFGQLFLSSDGAETQQVVRVVQDVLEGLHAAHQQGLVHHDIKPQSIIITEEGVAKVVNFGMHAFQRDLSVTRMAGVEGDVFYKAPEQIKGITKTGALTDIYHVGILMYDALAGRPAFTRSTDEFGIHKAIVEGAIPPPDKQRPGLPKPVARIIQRAIQRDPLRRYQSASEMLQALVGVSSRSGGADRSGRVRERTPLVFVAAIAAAFLIALILLYVVTR